MGFGVTSAISLDRNLSLREGHGVDIGPTGKKAAKQLKRSKTEQSPEFNGGNFDLFTSDAFTGGIETNGGQISAGVFHRVWTVSYPAKGCFGLILLKKSAVFSKAEKYASEIEILNVRRAFQAEISRRSVLKRLFHRFIPRRSEKTDFFNRIG